MNKSMTPSDISREALSLMSQGMDAGEAIEQACAPLVAENERLREAHKRKTKYAVRWASECDALRAALENVARFAQKGKPTPSQRMIQMEKIARAALQETTP